MRRTLGGQRAQSLVEFSLVLPLLMILVFGIIDFGMGFHSWMTMSNAAREGARVAATHAASSGSVHCSPLPAAGSIERRVCDTAPDLKASNVTMHVTGADPGGLNPGGTVTVQVTYTYNMITPFAALVHLSPLTMTTSVQMRLE